MRAELQSEINRRHTNYARQVGAVPIAELRAFFRELGGTTFKEGDPSPMELLARITEFKDWARKLAAEIEQ